MGLGQAEIYQQSSQESGQSGLAVAVTVSSAAAAGEIIQSDSPHANPSACAWPNFLGRNLVQDQAQINLNQPAACFRLVPGVAVAQNVLNVIEANTAGTVAVSSANSAPVFVQDSIQPGSGASNLPQSLPIAAAVALTLTLAETARRRVIKIKQSSQVNNLLSLPQLGMMRC